MRYNALPLSLYAYAENRKLINVPRGNLVLKSGRGPSSTAIKVVTKTNKDFCRLIGYYLSEGCLTKDESTRIRFCFHKKEHEYLRDVRNILRSNSIPFSEFHSKQWQSSYIKISSEVFGNIRENTLGCGKNCYEMSIPSQLFALPSAYRKEIVKGMLRGDGGVSLIEGKRMYKKHGQSYLHENNSAMVNYFTSSPKLLQQCISLLLDQGVFPKIQKRTGLIHVSGNTDLAKLGDYFDGEKKALLERFARNKKKISEKDLSLRHKTFFTAPVVSIETLPTDTVYSVEIEDTNTVVTSFGVVAHNCIAVDPYYLIERARKSGFEHRFLKMARQVNNGMPEYTVSLLENELAKIGEKISGFPVGLLGLAYKKDIEDVRESPALKILETLKKKKADVQTFDPFIPKSSTAKTLKSLLSHSKAIILATAHTTFMQIKPAEFKKAGVKIIIDGRNCLDKEKIIALGIAYKGIGH
jgi:hypothetical protein